ncbi:MAG: hypothetical protein ACK4S0_01820 [Sediminibacterium sp.]
MNPKLKIIITNWVNIVGVFIAVYIYGVINTLVDPEVANGTVDTLRLAFLGSLFGIVLYGMIFWIGYIVALIFLDFILIGKDEKNLYLKLMIQWGLISLPFIYWLFRYEQWVFLVAVIAFFITQNLRKNKIIKLLE